MRRIMRLPAHVQIEYKKHQDSLVDKSSFRNPSLVWKPKDAPAQRQGGYHKEGQGRDGHREREGGQGGHYNKEGGHREGTGGGGGGGYNKDHHSREKGTDHFSSIREQLSFTYLHNSLLYFYISTTTTTTTTTRRPYLE